MADSGTHEEPCS